MYPVWPNIKDNSELIMISIPNINAVGGDLDIYGNKNLLGINMPELVSVVGRLDLWEEAANSQVYQKSSKAIEKLKTKQK